MSHYTPATYIFSCSLTTVTIHPQSRCMWIDNATVDRIRLCPQRVVGAFTTVLSRCQAPSNRSPPPNMG